MQKYYPALTSALLMCVLLCIIYPFYQYYVDPDGTAYLTISKRYAAGDIQRAINGYWSPWACWLTAGLIKCGLEAIPAGVLINTLGAIGFIFISQSFFMKFDLPRRMQWALNLTLTGFLTYAIFAQSFDDLWECFFLLSSLRLLITENFKQRPALWILYGCIGTLAYFAKAYSFPFFILNTVCCTWLLNRDNKALWLKISAVSITVMLVCSLPWILALHNKYGIWTTSTSGSLNLSWYLVGHPHWKEGIKLLIPPAYPDSPYYWEDPWFANGDTPHFWDSLSLFGDLFIRTGYHVIKFVVSILQLSVFFPVITIVALLSFLLKRETPIYTGDLKIVALSFLLFPLGYFLINFEPRYIWYMVPLSMLLGAIGIQNNTYPLRISARILRTLFPLSFLIVPIIGLITMFGKGTQAHNLAQKLISSNIRGSFTGNIKPQFMEQLAYFSGNQYYFMLPSGDRYRGNGLFPEMQQYKVNYYIQYKTEDMNSFFHETEDIFNDSAMLSENKDKLTEVKIEGLEHFKIYKLQTDKVQPHL